MQLGDLLIELSAEAIDLFLVLVLLSPELDLGEGLVREAGAHDEAGVSGGAAEVHESSLGEHEHAVAILELPSGDHVLDDLFLHARDLREAEHVDLVVEVADVADDGVVLHFLHVARHDDVLVACRGHKDVDLRDDGVQFHHAVALHAGLQRADGVHFRHVDDCVLAPHGGRAALAHVAVPEHQHLLARDQNVAGPVESVRQRVSAPVHVVELRLRHGVVHVDACTLQSPFFF